MTSGRKIRFHNPRPSWSGRRPRQLGDSSDEFDTGWYDDSGDAGGGYDVPPQGADTTVSQLVVTASPSPGSVDVQPIGDILGPQIDLSSPSSWFPDLTSALPALNFIPTGSTGQSSGVTSPLTNLLNKLFPKTAGKSSSSSGGGGGSSSAPKLQAPSPLKPATSTAATATGLNPLVLWGAAGAGIVLLAAALSGHHERRGGGRR